MYSHIYNLGSHAPTHQQEQQEHYLPSSLIHVQGSSGAVSGTLPTFTFMPPQHHQPSQLPLQISVQPIVKVNNETMQQEISFRHNTIMPMRIEANASHHQHNFIDFNPVDSSSHDMLTNFATPFNTTDNNPTDAVQHVYYHQSNNSSAAAAAAADIFSEISSSPASSVSSNKSTVQARLPPLLMMNNQHSLSASLSISDDRSDVIKRQRETVRKGHTQRAPWTPAEDNLLRLAVQLYGDKTEKWSKIAACVPGRTNKNCRKRWFHSLDPSLRKGAWTDEEDQLLRDGVMKYPNQWSKIADMLEGRTDDQCAKRWRESLDPNIDRSDWTAAEDQLLMNKYEEFGSQWQKIAQFFEGRPGLHCRNRWRKLQRLVQMKKDKEEAAASMIPFVDGLPEHMQRTSALHFNSSNTSNSYLPQPARQGSRYEQHSSSEPPSVCNLPSALASTQTHSEFSPAIEGKSRMMLGNSCDMHGTNMQRQRKQQQQKDPISELNPYGCDIPGCYASFPQSSGLFYHMKTAHPSLEGYDKPYRCAIPNCSKRYKNINGLQYHLREAKGSSGHALGGRRASVEAITTR